MGCDEGVQVVDPGTGQPQQLFKSGEGLCYAARFSPDGQFVAAIQQTLEAPPGRPGTAHGRLGNRDGQGASRPAGLVELYVRQTPACVSARTASGWRHSVPIVPSASGT